MRRIAVIGGGIAGLAAAYELALLQKSGVAIDFVLMEASSRLGGIVETVRQDGFVVECGPDSWVTEKPWARELACELGLEHEIVSSQDVRRRTYLAEDRKLVAMPDGMRMMVPYQWEGILSSPLFSEQARLAYQREPELADHFKANALDAENPAQSPLDESVRDFVCRHFGAEVADTIAAPLLAGVFGGDISTLSARAVLPSFVALEREHGSLILGLQDRMRRQATHAPIFTALKNGLEGLVAGMEQRIPSTSIRRNAAVQSISHAGNLWAVQTAAQQGPTTERFDALVLATPARVTERLLTPVDEKIACLLPQQSSSAVVIAFAFQPERAAHLRIPQGFGFLTPQRELAAANSGEDAESIAQRALLACTFVDQKFPYRAPEGGVLLRGFFGGPLAPALLPQTDDALAALAHSALARVLGPLPAPDLTIVRRWPDSLPLYTVGHMDRMTRLQARVSRQPALRLIGNAYHGVGLPDLIRSGRRTAREAVDAALQA